MFLMSPSEETAINVGLSLDFEGRDNKVFETSVTGAVLHHVISTYLDSHQWCSDTSVLFDIELELSFCSHVYLQFFKIQELYNFYKMCVVWCMR
jgi:hypothetical protein